VVWIGNWGDDERTRELDEFLISPAESCDARFTIYGVRYPDTGLDQLARAGINFAGYLPNLSAPRAYSQNCLTLHVPRRCYSNGLSGIPTIRVFEAMACGIPLLCSPWTDVESLFRVGEDYICVPDGKAMAAEIKYFLHDNRARQQLITNGLRRIQERHTCAHRAQQLLSICEELER
jgi:spore maturation protein CgeB